MEDVVSQHVQGPTFRLLLIAAFAFIALVVSSVGIYGVIGFMVTLRSREIGLRMAIGANNADIKLIGPCRWIKTYCSGNRRRFACVIVYKRIGFYVVVRDIAHRC